MTQYDDQIRAPLANYVRDVVRLGYAYYPEAQFPIWPSGPEFDAVREAFYVAMVRLSVFPETAEKWGLTASEANASGSSPMIKMTDVDITNCPPGWIPLVERMVDELNAAGHDVEGIVAREGHGWLRVDYLGIGRHVFGEIGKIIVLAQFRSMYVCSACGAPGEHRRGEPYHFLSTRCPEHQDHEARAGTVRYDLHRRPMRRMTEGDLEYDPVTDTMVRLYGRLADRYEKLLVADARIDLDPAAEVIVDEVLREIQRMPLAADYRISALYRDRDGHLVVEDNIYYLPGGNAHDVVMSMLSAADDRVSKLPLPELH